MQVQEFQMRGEYPRISNPRREQAWRERRAREACDSGILPRENTIYPDVSGMISKRDEPIDMYNMSGFINFDIMTACLSKTVDNLVDMNNVTAQEIQRELVEVLGSELFGLPENTEGLVLHSGSEANEVALSLAKQTTGKRLVLVSSLTHQSIIRACEKLDLEILTLECDPNFLYEVPSAILEKVLEKRGGELAAIVATTGTTQLGTNEGFIDHPLIEKLCREQDVWLHLDAAYGGTIANLISDEYPSAIYPWLARSITVDAHKFVGPLGCSALLLPQKGDKQMIGPEVPYFSSHAAALGTTRSAFEPAVALATMKALGRKGLRKLAIMAPIQLGVVPIELPSQEAVEYMKESLKARGFLVSPVHIEGKNYSKWGIRIVVTPKSEMTDENLENFIIATTKIYKSMIDNDYKKSP